MDIKTEITTVNEAMNAWEDELKAFIKAEAYNALPLIGKVRVFLGDHVFLVIAVSVAVGSAMGLLAGHG